MELTNSSINRLGERLRENITDEPLLDELDFFRQSFTETLNLVQDKLQNALRIECNTRSKSTPSIIAKLLREKTRLSKIQDIAGLRVVVSDILEQNDLLLRVLTLYPTAKIIDRRTETSFGYRAVHLVLTEQDKKIELQIRTWLQHQWAQISELAADIKGHELKYGSGEQHLKTALSVLSEAIQTREDEKLAGFDNEKNKADFKKIFMSLSQQIHGYIFDGLNTNIDG
jgi:putative GTP pyrophosphokinase